MAEREDGTRGDHRDPPLEAEDAGPRVVRIADLAGAAPRLPVASLRDLATDGEQASVVDLRTRERDGGGPPVAPRHRGRVRPAGAMSADARGGPGRPGGATTDDQAGTAARVARFPAAGAPRRRDRAQPPAEEAPPTDAPTAAAAQGNVARRSGGATADPARDGRSTGRRAGPVKGAARQTAADTTGTGEPRADPEAVAREICLRLLTERARTRQELAQTLRKRGVPDDAAGTVLERFDEVGLIDDAAFAGQWVRSRHNQRGLARRAIAVELRRKGVADEVAQEALAEVDTASEEQRARELVDRKLRTIPADTPERRATAARRLVGMLARRGYPGGIAYRVVREALAAHGAEEDELGTEPDL